MPKVIQSLHKCCDLASEMTSLCPMRVTQNPLQPTDPENSLPPYLHITDCKTWVSHGCSIQLMLGLRSCSVSFFVSLSFVFGVVLLGGWGWYSVVSGCQSTSRHGHRCCLLSVVHRRNSCTRHGCSRATRARATVPRTWSTPGRTDISPTPRIQDSGSRNSGDI